MNVPGYIARRYLLAKSRQTAVNLISAVTLLVALIGSASLFVVLSGFSGLKEFSIAYTEMTDPDLKVLPIKGKYLTDVPALSAKINALKGVAASAPELEERVYLTHGEKSQTAWIKGVAPNWPEVIPIEKNLYLGDWDVEGVGILGLGLAQTLGVTVGPYSQPIGVLVPKPLKKGALSTSTPYEQGFLTLSAVYAVDADWDQKYLITDLRWVQALLGRDPEQATGISIKLNEQGIQDPAYWAQQIQKWAPNQYVVKTRIQLNSALYKMLNTEYAATYGVFTLVLIIALFNLVGAMITIILDKRQNADTLFALGLTSRDIQRIYLIQGIGLSVIGGLGGLLLGSALIGSQLYFGWLEIGAGLAYPVAFEWKNFLLVVVTISVLGSITSWVASRRAARVDS